MTNPRIDTVINFLAAQMDGCAVPPSNSAAMRELSGAIQSLHQHDSTPELRELGLRALGLAIDRGRSGIAAEATLRAFIAPGGNHA